MSDTESKVRELIEETLSSLGFNIVLIKFFGVNTKTLQIFIERQNDDKITVADCREASYHISTILDVEEDLITDKYHLEVSSPGVERPLVILNDFQRFAGNVIIIKLRHALEGRKALKGQLCGIEGNEVVILDQESKQKINVNFDNIKNSNIVLTDELYKQILKKAK